MKFNYQYAYIEKGKVTRIRPTVTKIPKEMWAKKGLLPFEVNTVSLPEGAETDLVEGLVIFEDKVVQTIIKRFKVLTLEEYKIQKKLKIAQNTKNHVLEKYPDYKQMSAAMGLYDEIETNEIKAFTKTHMLGARALMDSIDECISKDDIDTLPDIYKEVQ